ncbi:MAG: hypothetical protein COB02_03955 [Candidatus Cloacimonadota bacterium]|nr:MAG: hypothetical protein COB02_03955 [Candidatus Cloacimonadota bacterium]
MKKVPFVINCEQLDIDVNPSKSWILENLDGECYLEKMIRLAKDSDLFSAIFLLVPETEEYSCYDSFAKNEVSIVHCKKSDFHWKIKDQAKTWNKYIRMYERIPCWNYQLSKRLKVEFVYSIDAYVLMPTYEVMKRAIEMTLKDLYSYHIVIGVGYVQGSIFPIKYLEKYYYQDTHLNKLKCLDFNELKSYVKVEEKLLRNNYTNLVRKCLTFGRKEFFNLIREYFIEFPNKYDLTEETQDFLYKYLNKNIYKIDLLPKTIEIKLDDKSLPENFVALFEKASEIGRLTFIICFDERFEDWDTLIALLIDYNLHYILKTDGDLDCILFKKLIEVFDIIDFNLNDYSKERLQVLNSTVNYNRVFNNFDSIANYRDKNASPQIGILCVLPSDKVTQLSIVNYWFDRMDFCFGLSSFQIIGDKNPKIQYIKYFHEDESQKKADIIVNLKGFDNKKYKLSL